MRLWRNFVTGVLLVGLLSACNHDAPPHYSPQGSEQVAVSYVIGVHPYLNSQRLFLAYEPILRYLEAHIPNTHFKLETSADYISYEQKLYSGHFQFALPNPYQTIKSFNAGYYAFARMKPDTAFRGMLVSRKDQRIRTVAQLKKQAIAFPAKTALAATMMPKYFLLGQGINVDRDMQPRYVSSQYSSIMNAYTKDVLIAGTWPTAFEAWKQDYPKEAEEMEVVWETPHLVNNALVARVDVDPQLVKTVADLLIHLADTEAGRAILAPTACNAFEAANNMSFEPVFRFLADYQASGLN